MKDRNRKEILAVFLVVLSATMWGCIGIFVRQLNMIGFDFRQQTVLKCLLAAGLLFLFILMKDRSLLRVRPKDIPWFLVNGACSLYVCFTAYSMATTLLPLSMAVVLLYTAPAFVMLLSVIFFKERFTVRKGLCLVLCIGGIVLVSDLTGRTLNFPLKGLGIGLGAGIGYGLYSIISGVILRKGYHPFTNVLYSFLVAGLVGCLKCDVFGTLRLAFSSGEALRWVFMSVLITCFPYILYTTALRYIKPSKAAILASLEPVVATLMGVLLYKEILTLSGFIGITLVFSGLVISNFPEKE